MGGHTLIGRSPIRQSLRIVCNPGTRAARRGYGIEVDCRQDVNEIYIQIRCLECLADLVIDGCPKAPAAAQDRDCRACRVRAIPEALD